MNIPEHIFKAYDIRGLAEGELSPELAYLIGRAFVQLLRERGVDLQGKKIVVGRDMRVTSPVFQERVFRGIQDEGVVVVDIGLVTTPLFNFACANYPKHAGGIMVTASHNPAQDNGFKMCFGAALPVPGKDMLPYVKKVAAETSADAMMPADPCEQLNPRADYFTRLFSLVPKESILPQSLVIDFGNGMGSVTFQELLAQLPQVKTSYLYAEPDGNFPNHEANPLKTETLRDLQTEVKKQKADFGFALDGDADRIGMVDEQGGVVDATLVATLVSQEVIKAHKPGLLLHSVQCGSVLGEAWQAAGGTVEFCQNGHASIKKMMREKSALFAAELSLHLYFHDMFNVESGDLSLLYILRLLSREKKPLTSLFAPYKKYFHSGETNYEVVDKDGVMKRVEDALKNQAIEVSHLDGLWMKFDWGWVSVRKSNTESLLRLNVEAKTREMMEEKVLEVKQLITE